MKKIVVTLLLGLFAFPAAFALDGNEMTYAPQFAKALSNMLEYRAKKAHQKATADAVKVTDGLFKQYPNAKILPTLAKTYAVLSYKTYVAPPRGFSAREWPNPFEDHSVKVPAAFIETTSHHLGLVAVPASAFNAMNAADAGHVRLTVSLAKVSKGETSYTDEVSFGLKKTGCPKGVRYDLAKTHGICVFSVPTVKDLDDTFEGFFAVNKGKLLPSKVAAAFKK